MILLLGYGFLGKSLAGFFKQRSMPFSVADRNVHHLSEEHHVYFDLNDSDTYAAALTGIDTVIHLIHPTVPADSDFSESVDLVHNLAANKRFLDYLPQTGVKRILYISSGGAIYGTPNYLPVDELHPCNPVSNYGKGKLLLEKLYQEKCMQYGIQLTIIRPSNIYGQFQKTDKPQGVIAHLAEAFRENKPFVFWGDGTQQKDYLYIHDFATAILAVLSNNETASIHYNVSAGTSYTLPEIISIMESILHQKVQTSYAAAKRFDVKTVILSNEKFVHEFKWTAQYSLEEGLKDLLKPDRDL